MYPLFDLITASAKKEFKFSPQLVPIESVARVRPSRPHCYGNFRARRKQNNSGEIPAQLGAIIEITEEN
jgi:hypothetical protein